MTQLDLGLALKEEGMARAAAGNDEFLAQAQRYAIWHSNKYGRVTADDVREYADKIGLKPTSPHVWGSVFRGKGWRVIGHHKSARPGNHAHEYRMWRWQG